MKRNKKRIVVGLVFLFLFSIIIPTIDAGYEQNINSQGNNLQFTHKVLGELCTSTTCGYCPAASDQMNQVYNMGYNFVYVSLVGNKNTYASSRMSELGFTGYPSVAFDGGYRKIIGQQSNSNPYENAVIDCGNREVADIDLDLNAYWMGDGEIQVNVEITNNEDTTYNGHIHVYVTEKTSRWNDASGDAYHFAMINNYAINQNIQVPAYSTKIILDTWNGYSDISFNNIRLIGTVFSQSPRYTDESAITDPQYPNTDAPSKPGQPNGPSSGCVGIEYTFSTSATEPNGDVIEYGWDWNNDNSVDEWTDYHPSGETIEASHSWQSTGTYNFKVKARDQFGDESSFSSEKQIQIGICDPPGTPTKPDGETDGIHATPYSYTTTATDPNIGDRLYYKFDWGDESSSSWKGPFDEGEPASISHTWIDAGTFEIKVKAKDLAGSESDWSDELTIEMGNTPPNKPQNPTGPSYGIVGIEYEFSTFTTDPEHDSIEYNFDWGDGTTSGWTRQLTAEHAWLTTGQYKIRAKARDRWDESDWSSSWTITLDQGSLQISIDADPNSAILGEEIQFSASASGGKEPYTFNWDFGDGNTSIQQFPTHIYQKRGNYVVSVSVQDDAGAYGSNYTDVNIEISNPPDIPIFIDGKDKALTYESCDFTFSISDPDDDDIYLLVDWGDNTQEEWKGPFDSGESIVLNHQWNNEGLYNIKVKAKDINDYESDWSETFEVTVYWQEAFLIGKINEKIEKENFTKIGASSILAIHNNPFKIDLYNSNETIIISEESEGFIGNKILFGKFKIGYI